MYDDFDTPKVHKTSGRPHDHMCPDDGDSCECSLITLVRMDERHEIYAQVISLYENHDASCDNPFCPGPDREAIFITIRGRR